MELKLCSSGGVHCLEGHGDLVSRLTVKITRVIIGAIGVINPLTKFP